MSYRIRNHEGALLSTSLPVVIIEVVVDSFDLTVAEKAFKREGCTSSSNHDSTPVEYWQEWVREFELIFINTYFHKKNVLLDRSLKAGINCKIKVQRVFWFLTSMFKTFKLTKNFKNKRDLSLEKLAFCHFQLEILLMQVLTSSQVEDKRVEQFSLKMFEVHIYYTEAKVYSN